jgi:hypothetical protein
MVGWKATPPKMNIRSESHTKVSPKRAWTFPLRVFAPSREPLAASGARRDLIDFTRRRKAAKKMRERDNFMEYSPFKKPRKSQEVDIESVYSLSPQDVKKWHNRSATATQ